MVIGTKSTLLKSEYIAGQCPNCHSNYSVQMNVFQRYVHVCWIPFFRFEKTGVSRCDNCHQVLELYRMPESLKLSYERLKVQTRGPLWHFSGLVLALLCVVALIITEKQKIEKVSKLVQSPQKDDIFEVKIKDDQYTLYKVAKVKGDTVYFFANKLQTDQEEGLSQLLDKGPQGFATDSIYGLSKSALIKMDKKDEIIDIDRK